MVQPQAVLFITYCLKLSSTDATFFEKYLSKAWHKGPKWVYSVCPEARVTSRSPC